jgi:hypothetical protein
VNIDHATKRILTTVEIATTVLAGYMILRMLAGPDGMKTVFMFSTRGAARFAKRQGEWWTEVGGKLDSVYWKIAA